MFRSVISRVALATLWLTALSAPLAAVKVRVEGSDTIGGALGPDLAEAYHLLRPQVLVEWEALGSSTAFVGLFDRSADLGASSRPVKEEELLEARRLGIQLREWVLAYDGIAVIVHLSNPLPSLTVQQTSDIFRGRIRNFREVGGLDRPIRLLSRPSYSGTHSFFKEKVLRRGNAKGPEEFAESTEWVEHSSEIVARVAADPSAISFLGLGWVRPNVRAVPLAPGRAQPPVTPSLESVRTGTYPVFRALYLYSRGEPTSETRDLLAFALSPEGQEIVARNGFVPTDASSPLPFPSAAATAADGIVSPPLAPTREAIVAAPDPSSAASAAGAGAAKPAPSVSVVEPVAELVRIYFASGGVLLTEEAHFKLARVATRLRGSGAHAQVVGHADAIGTAEANRRVSLARALTVRAELARLGAPPAAISTEAKGSDQPTGTNETADGRRQNRRVDILLTSDR